jgi:hypothetical protein
MIPTLLKRRISTAKKLTIQNYYRLCGKTDLTWRYVANFRPWLEYQRTRSPMSNRNERLLRDLVRNGILTTSIAALLNNTCLFEELEAAVQAKEAELVGEIQKTRANMVSSDGIKSYFLPLLGSQPILDPNNIFARFALHPHILNLVNGYFGMLTKLRYYNVWHNVVSQDSPRESQLWHRDPEDRAVLKVFVYLTDVDANCGPLSYAPGTHMYGNIKKAAPFTLYNEGNAYVQRSDDEQIAAIIPKSKWITATVPKGTIVVVDTRGYHKGGYVREGDRILYTCAFTSKGSVFRETWKRQNPFRPPDDKAIAYAIGR